ncbi:hypothetical protein I5R65_07815 [Herbaspirillum sp. AP02]|uniref:hypothetical protein n=1 Tax=unclassified Herbaspirillum TaxID=2624150 RepID=UPI0015DAD4A1|nr:MULTISPECIES: hypothetical protein [unclassified Herbaspirillum]MBG7619367.1 hypothetical protein [Herbaspirillum sp. AP02]NZD66651.1 hypothetical protein [Herbaspirillum sp. AP21]
MQKFALIITAAALTGCATWGQLDDGLKGLLGQPIDVAINKIGYPNSEQTIAGRKLYRWGSSSQQMAYMPTTTTTNGYAGVGSGFTPYSSTTTGGTFVPLNYTCQITLEVDAKQIIQRYQADGNLGGCEPYIKALKK